MSIVAYVVMVSGGAWLSYVTVWFTLLIAMKPSEQLKAVEDKGVDGKAQSAARRRSAYFHRSASAEADDRYNKFYVDVDKFDAYSTPKIFAKKRPIQIIPPQRHVPHRLAHLDLTQLSQRRVKGASVA